MASPLIRQALQSARSIASGSTRQINTTTSTQDSWFSRLIWRAGASEKTESGQANQDRLPQPSAPKSVEARSKHVQDVPVKSTPQPAQATTPMNSTPATMVRRKRTRRLAVHAENAGNKIQSFDKNILFMEPRLGRNPHIYHPSIRQSTWIRTLGLCQNEEQLRKVMDMIPLWRDMDLKFDTTFSHAFIRRCLYLNKPEFALELFCDFGKYNVPFTLDGAREILSVTYDKQSIGFIITLTRLFNVYKLGPVKNDYPCCAMVIAACLKSKRKDAMILADTLLPHLKNMVDASVLPKLQKTDQKLSLA